MNLVKAIACLLVATLLAGCNNNPAVPVSRELTQIEKRLVKSDNSFGLKLFKQIAQIEQKKNVFISPLSVSMALGMTLNGAANATREAMAATLELEGLTSEEINQTYKSLIALLIRLDPEVVFELANSIWYRQEYTFEQAFIDANIEYFDAEVQGLNFDDPNSVDIINDWVKRKTHDNIESIVEEIDPEIVMFLINAIYFKSNWTYEFDKDATQDDFFRLLDGSEKQIRMMNRTGDYPYSENDSFQAVDLPYGEQLFSMTVLLPKPTVSLDSLIAELNLAVWQQWIASLAETEVELSMPKFKLEYEISLKDVLSSMGMAIAFIPFEADFSGMYTGPEKLYIDKVKHKTFIEVDEEGTEAAAVTSVEIGITSVPVVVPMRIDRPFLFVIRESKSGTILFIGRIIDPEA